jgi:hypothetical protein
MPTSRGYDSTAACPSRRRGAPCTVRHRRRAGADHGGIRAEGPVRALGLVAPGPQPAQDLLPGPVQQPAAMPVISGLPVPVLPGQVPPRAPVRARSMIPLITIR